MQNALSPAPDARHFNKANPDDVHAKLSQLAKTKSAFDVEVGEWLLAAQEHELHEVWGFTDFESYVHKLFGWDHRAVRERLRVAAKLETLPLVRDRLLDGKMSWSVAREITRIPESPEIEREWVEKTEGKTARQVARMVLGLGRNARPGSKKDPGKITHRRTVELTSEELAIFEDFLRDARAHADEKMTDGKALIHGITNLPRGRASDTGVSRHQIAFVKKIGDETLYVSTSEGPMPLPPLVAERIECDATTLPPTVDGKIAGKAAQSIPPSHHRQVVAEAGGLCEVQCGRCLHDVHHTKFRKDGGTHEVKFLIGLCWGCHARVHEGFLRIEGDRESGYRFFQANGEPYASLRGRPTVLAAIGDAVQGFNRLGCKDPESRRLAEDAAKGLLAEGKGVTGEAVFERGLRARGRVYKMTAPPASAHVCQAEEKLPGATTVAAAPNTVSALVGDAISGLRNMGLREGDARTYVERAAQSVGEAPTIEALLSEALRMRGQSLLAREGRGGGESVTGGSEPVTGADPVEGRIAAMFRAAFEAARGSGTRVPRCGPCAKRKAALSPAR